MPRRRARSCGWVWSAARRGRPRRRRCWSRKATSRFRRAFLGRTYDVSPDGQRFLMIKEGGGTDQTAAPAQPHRRAALDRGTEAPRADELTLARVLRSLASTNPTAAHGSRCYGHRVERSARSSANAHRLQRRDAPWR